MDVSVIKFPAICLAKDNTIDVVKDQDELTICSKPAFKHGYCKDMEIIDSNGSVFVVTGVELKKTMPCYWKWRSLVMPTMIKVDLMLNKKRDYQFEEAREFIISKIQQSNYLTDAAGGSIIKKKIREAKSLKELFAVVGEV